MTDPLSLLRQYHVNQMEIVEKGDKIIFGEFIWTRCVKTNYLKWGSGKDGKVKEYYTLESLLYLLKNVNLSHPVYVRNSAAENIQVVTRPDRNDILAYLRGEILISSSIDQSAPLQIPSLVKIILVEAAGDDELTSPSKKPRFEQSTLIQKCKETQPDGLDMRKKPIATRSLSEALSVEKVESPSTMITSTNNENIEKELFEDVRTKGIISKEREGRTRTTILQSNRDLFSKRILQSIETIEESRSSRSVSVSPAAVQFQYLPSSPAKNRYDSASNDSSHNVTTTRSPNKRESQTPIIIVPASTTSLITMFNAKEILQDLTFISSEVNRAQGMNKNSEIMIYRRKNGVSVPYRVIDNPEKLKPRDWDRVVAVFILGPSWQFKGWPWNPLEIFSKISVFHLKYDDMILDANVQKWSIVNIIQLSVLKRHLDRAALMNFWDKLDLYMGKNKPFLRY